MQRTRPAHYAAYALLLMLYMAVLTLVPSISPFVTAALWLLPVLLLCFVLPAVHMPGKSNMQGAVLGYAIMGAVFYLAALFVTGALLKALAASPYDLSPSGIFFNLLRIVPPLLAREMIRAYSLGAAWRACKYRKTAAVLITAVLFITDLHVARIAQLSDLESAVSYTVQTIAPALTQNVLLSVLAFYGGAGAGIAYAAIPAVFLVLFPFLPNLPWLAQGAIGICFPLVLALITNEHFHAASREKKAPKDGGTVGFVASLFCAVLFSWFVVGVFPVYPSVVLTGSMEPMIDPGDVVLIQKFSEESEIYALKEGDVINFRRGDITITHRITEVLLDEADNLTFQTKGDNNESVDAQLVLPNDINGTIKQVVPKVGVPILKIKSGQEIPEGVVDDA